MIILNEKDNKGIAIAVVYNNNVQKYSYIMLNKEIRLFDNLDVAKAVMGTVEGIDKSKTKFFIMLDGKEYEIGKQAKKIGDCFYITDMENKQIIKVQEKNTNRYSNFGYISFGNFSSSNITNHNDAKEQNNEFFNMIKDSVTRLFCSNTVIKSVEVLENELVINLKHCTGSIHICKIESLIGLNQARKQMQLPAFPFVKNVDKYGAFYSYMCRELSEPLRMKTDIRSKEILDYIIEDLKHYDEKMEFVPSAKNNYTIFEH